MKGCTINQKCLKALNKTVEIQSRMLADVMNSDADEMLKAVKAYTNALTQLEDYDHQDIPKPKGSDPVYWITYEECWKMMDHNKSGKSEVFGIEKAANLLYFMIKDHPYLRKKNL